MLANNEIRALSREQLKGKWAKMALLTLVVLIVTGVPSYFFLESSYGSLITGVVTGLLFFGVLRVTFNIANRNEFDLNEYFKSGRSYLRYLLFSILLSLITIVISIVFIFVSTIAFGVSLMSFIPSEAALSSTMSQAEVARAVVSSIPLGIFVLIFVVTILYMFLMIVIEMIYSQTSYIIIRDHDDIGVIDSMRFSRKLMKGYKLRFFLLNLSFIGWGILSILTLGIGLLWLIPYFYVSNANFFLELIKEREDLAREMDIVDAYAGDYFRTYENEYGVAGDFGVDYQNNYNQSNANEEKSEKNTDVVGQGEDSQMNATEQNKDDQVFVDELNDDINK